MKLLRAIVGLFVVGLLPLPAAQADIPPLPADLPKGKDFRQLEVRVAPTKDISFLRISRKALEDAGLEIRDKKKTGAWSPSTQRSIFAAMALSLGVAGVFFARKKRGAAIAVSLVAASVVGTIGVQAWANLAPLPDRRQPIATDQPNATDPVKNFNGKVVIEITDDNEGVQLFIGTKPEPKYQRVLPPDQRPSSEKGS